MLDLTLAAATVTILSGAYLLWVDSDGFGSAWFGTRFGVTISVGMVAALIAFAILVAVVRPIHAQLDRARQNVAASPSRADRRDRIATTEQPARLQGAETIMALLLVAATGSNGGGAIPLIRVPTDAGQVW